jgi:hypothetical protein
MYCMYLHVFVCIMHVSCMYNFSEYAFYEVDTSGYSYDMQIHVFVCIRYKWICTACIWYVLNTAGVYAVHICMYHDTICAQMTSAHICMYPSTFWWAWTHCRMITAMDTLQALKQVRQTHGFETMLEIALYCFRVVSRVVSRPYHGPRVDVVLRAARLGSPRRLHSPLGKQASLLLDMLREMVPQSPAGNSSPITTIIYSLIHTNTVWYSHI